MVVQGLGTSACLKSKHADQCATQMPPPAKTVRLQKLQHELGTSTQSQQPSILAPPCRPSDRHYEQCSALAACASSLPLEYDCSRFSAQREGRAAMQAAQQQVAHLTSELEEARQALADEQKQRQAHKHLPTSFPVFSLPACQCITADTQWSRAVSLTLLHQAHIWRSCLSWRQSVDFRP